VHSLSDPRIDVLQEGAYTGCCFGGRLTALVFEALEREPRIVQVPAERAYVTIPNGTSSRLASG
jgi:hypothetical protein